MEHDAYYAMREDMIARIWEMLKKEGGYTKESIISNRYKIQSWRWKHFMEQFKAVGCNLDRLEDKELIELFFQMSGRYFR